MNDRIDDAMREAFRELARRGDPLVASDRVPSRAPAPAPSRQPDRPAKPKRERVPRPK